jgi:hypothetical protein
LLYSGYLCQVGLSLACFLLSISSEKKKSTIYVFSFENENFCKVNKCNHHFIFSGGGQGQQQQQGWGGQQQQRQPANNYGGGGGGNWNNQGQQQGGYPGSQNWGGFR